ncbi:MAG: nicotinate-nucleotide adenylyltransferase [Dehalococcoidia bacterium]|nr:nicotinate-nucleotide adenylyltransferase [Dehalococcoidia bacterium]
MNIAVLGGTFDPIHNGHLEVASVVGECLAPCEVLFMPAGYPYLKDGYHFSAASARLEMTHLAVSGNGHWRVSSAETDRSGPTYTLDTMLALKKGLGAFDKLYFIIGWDKLAELPRWHKPDELIKICQLVAVPRVGVSAPDLSTIDKFLPGLSQVVVLLERPEVDISSSVIRERVKLGLPIDNFTPPAVATYIAEKGLYKVSMHKGEGQA